MSDVTTPAVDGTYEPQLTRVLDRMRSTVGDVGPEFLIPDATYDAFLQMEGEWRLATAAIADQLAGMYIQKPTSFTATGDFSAGWTNRAAEWRKLAISLRQAVSAERASHVIGAKSVRPVREEDEDPWEYTRPRR